jgi:hypothetical protein
MEDGCGAATVAFCLKGSSTAPAGSALSPIAGSFCVLIHFPSSGATGLATML